METRRDKLTKKEAFDRGHAIIKSDLSACCMDLKFSVHTYFRTRNSNLSSICYKNERLFLVIAK